MLACITDRTNLPPTIILKQLTISKKYDSYRKDILMINANALGWVNEQIMFNWIKGVWSPFIKSVL